MQPPILFGTLVLHAARQVPILDVPELHDLPRKTGQHVKGRYNGRWCEINNVDASAIYLPQRYKHLALSCTNPEAVSDLTKGLEGLDSLYPDARQLYKLNCLLATMVQPFAAVVNMESAVQDGSPVSGTLSLLSRDVPIYFALVFNIAEDSVQLVWSTLDFKSNIQARNLFQYVFFPFPPIVNRPVFIPTQALCSRWWKFIKGFGEGRHGLIRAANALEIMLYKDPNVESYGSKNE